MLWADYAVATASEWYRACSSAGKSKYSYGAQYDARACVGDGYDGKDGYSPSSDRPQPVGTASACHGGEPPFAKIMDLSGNLAEWEDACATFNGADDFCLVRGGSYFLDRTLLACDAAMQPRTRSDAELGVGFRCCKD